MERKYNDKTKRWQSERGVYAIDDLQYVLTMHTALFYGYVCVCVECVCARELTLFQ